MIYSTLVIGSLAVASAFEARPVLAQRPVVHRGAPARTPALQMSAGRRAQIGAIAAAAAAISQAAVAAEPRSTPWAYSTFLEAVETDQIEKVSFAADGKQCLSIDKDGNRWACLRQLRPSLLRSRPEMRA
jgi:hypothetical protein